MSDAATAAAGVQAIRARQSQQTATGFPAGSLPGDSARGGDDESEPPARVAMVGDPLAPIIGSEMLGYSLDRISAIASHVGYHIVKVGFSPTVMDTPYTFALMSGNRRISRLFFTHSMTLAAIQ